MGVFGQLFPGPKISDEAGEDVSGQPWRLGPIDLESNTVVVERPASDADDPAEPGEQDDIPESRLACS